MIAEKKSVRRLALSKETLRQLSNTELKRAAGGASTSSYTICTDLPPRQRR